MSIAALLQAAEYLEERDRDRDRDGRGGAFALAGREHGYACEPPAPAPPRSHPRLKRPKGKKSQGSRTTHNELEKNRRAHLRTCLEKLKDMVPLGPEASKHTTLGLLTKAKRFIKNLEERDKRHSLHKEQLAREQRFLRRKLEQLESRGENATGTALLRRRFQHQHQHPHQQQYVLGAPPATPASPAQPAPPTQIAQLAPLTAHILLSRRSISECSSASASSGSVSRCDQPDSEPASISESDEVDVIGYTSNQSDTDDHSSIQSGSGDSGVALSASRLSLAHMEII